jgi:hypothetical protein
MKIKATRGVASVALSSKRWRKIMKIKYILAAALITPLLTVSSTAQQYVGGPKSGIAPTTQISSASDIYAQGVDARGVKANKSHAYRAGPKTVVPR